MKSTDRAQFLWGGRGVFVGAIIEVVYDIAQYGISKLPPAGFFPEPFLTLGSKIFAFSIALLVGLAFWIGFDKSSKKPENTDNNH
ncbi:MAG: hypothetical protein WA799_00930 [Nitrosotalea sp.]